MTTWVRAFVADVAARVKDQLAERLADVIAEKTWGLFSRSSRRDRKFEPIYLGYVEAVWRIADQSGLPSIAPRALKVDDVFVHVSLVYRPPGQVPHGVVGIEPEHAAERQRVWDFLGGTEPRQLALIGVPGSGKSTLLQHIALNPDGPPDKKRRYRTLPVLLRLRDCAASITADPVPLLPEIVTARLGRLPTSPPPGWVARQLAGGRCTVMFDGLDEVAAEQDRRAIVAWITEQTELYPGNDYLVTSRPRGYRENPLPKAEHLQLREFTPEQVRQFTRGWYRATEALAPGRDGEARSGLPPASPADDEAEDLIRRLEDNTPLGDFAVNPLLLTMTAIVHRYNKGVLPDTRAELYAQMCEVLLERSPHAKPLPAPLAPGQKETVLADLAFTMMSRQAFDLPVAEVTKVTGDSLAELGSALDARQFLENVKDSGLLMESERGAWSFAHPTFQEYLAAVGIRSQDRRQALMDNIGSAWWRESTLLYSARTGAGAIVEAGLASGELGPLILAVECADADPYLEPGLRRQLDELLLDAANPGVPTRRRRLAAAVAATRELRSTVRLAGGTRICATPVTRRVRELFTYQKNAEYPERVGAGAPDTGSGEPAVGVASIEAAEIVEWLNDLLRDAETVFRFPTRAEAEDPRFSGNPLVRPYSVWLAPEGEGHEAGLWCTPPERHPYLVSASQLRAGAAADADGVMGGPLAVVLAFALVHTLAAADALARAHGPGHTRNLPELAVRLRGELEQVQRLGRRLVAELGPGSARGLRTALESVLDGALSRPGEPGFAADLTIALVGQDVPRGRVPALALDLARIRAAELADGLRAAVGAAGAGGETVPRLARPAVRAGDHADRVGPAFNRMLDTDLDLACHLNLTHPAAAGLDAALCALFGREAAARGPREVLDLVWGPGLQDVVAVPAQRTVVPGLMRRLARDGDTQIRAMTPGLEDDHLRGRAAVVAERISGIVADLEESDPRIAPEAISFVRFGALAIAVGARRAGWDAGFVGRYVDIAAGITALERRADGRALCNEVVVLVRG